MQDKNSLRIFGFLWSLILGFFTLKYNNNILIILSITFFVSSIFFPQIYLKTFIYQGWIKFGNFIGHINSKIIIFLLFFLIFTPMGFILKAAGKDFLSKRLDKYKPTYLLDRESQPGSMLNQF